MEENIIKESEAIYLESSVKMFKGNLVLTDQRIIFTGEHERIKLNHGILGNVVRDKLEKKMGYDKPEESVFDLSLSGIDCALKKFLFAKNIIITDKTGKTYKVQIVKKADTEDWVEAINKSKLVG